MNIGVMAPVSIIALLIVFACLHIWQQVHIMNVSREVTDLKKENSRLEDLLKKSNADIAELSRLSRIEKLAADEMGLVRTPSENLYTIIMDNSYGEYSGFSDLVQTLQKVAEHMPVLSESKAETTDIFGSDEE